MSNFMGPATHGVAENTIANPAIIDPEVAKRCCEPGDYVTGNRYEVLRKAIGEF